GGFLFDLLAAGALSVSGVEQVTERAHIAQDRGLTVINDDAGSMPLAQIPVADVYYFYGDNLEDTGRILKRVLTTPMPGTFAFGVNSSHYFLVDYFRLRGAVEKTVAGGHFKIFILTIT
ncbi:unnamed protein product, partial [marine sediment metagenome]